MAQRPGLAWGPGPAGGGGARQAWHRPKDCVRPCRREGKSGERQVLGWKNPSTHFLDLAVPTAAFRSCPWCHLQWGRPGNPVAKACARAGAGVAGAGGSE